MVAAMFWTQMFYSSAFRIRATSRGHVGYPRNGGNKNPSFSYDPVTKWFITHTYICIYIWDIYMGYVHICTCIQFIYNMISLSFPRLHFSQWLANLGCSSRAAKVRCADFRLMELLRHEIQKLRRPYGSATGQVLLERTDRERLSWSHGMGLWDMKFLTAMAVVVFHVPGRTKDWWSKKMMQENGERTGCKKASKIGMSTPESWK